MTTDKRTGESQSASPEDAQSIRQVPAGWHLPAIGLRRPRSNASATPRRITSPSERPLLWLAILLGFATAFYLYPAVEVIRFSFTNSTLLRSEYSYTFNTILRTLGRATTQDSVKITMIFVIGSVALQTLLGLGSALVLQRGTARRLIGTALVRSTVLMAWIMPGVVIGVVWKILVNEASFGMINTFVRMLGFSNIAFLSDRSLALATGVVAAAWRGAAFSMILLYAGLQSIPHDLYEAAQVDGASRLKLFWYITLPQLKPILAINLILATIGATNSFDLILALTGGGPGRATEVLSLLTYNTLFTDFDTAAASVLALVMLALSLLFTVLYAHYMKQDVL